MKVQNVGQFSQTIADFQFLPRPWSTKLAYLFLMGEFATVVFLLMGKHLLSFAFGLALLLLISFTIALLSALRRKIQTKCNCFGNNENSLGFANIWRNMGLIIVSGIGLWAMAGDLNMSLSILESLFITLSALVFVLVWVNLANIATLFRTT
jgi:hypothetical protein